MKTKSVAERIAELRRLYEQLEAFGLHEGLDAIAEFRKMANDFVRNGESTTGAIPIVPAKRILVYTFSSDPKVPCNICLKAMKY